MTQDHADIVLAIVLIALLWLLALAVGGHLGAAEPYRAVIPLRAPGGTVCAEYLSLAAPRTANRSCVDAATVREWILRNAGPHDEACEGDQ